MRVHEFRAEMKRFCISGLGAKRRGQCLPRSKSPSRVTTLSRSETGLWKLSALVNRDLVETLVVSPARTTGKKEVSNA